MVQDVFIRLRNLFFGRRKGRLAEIAPDEIFLDASNLPAFDRHQFEGRLETPIAKRSMALLVGGFCIVSIILLGRLWILQIASGQEYATLSENNSLRHSIVFGKRGVIYDRNDTLLAWNSVEEGEAFAARTYTATSGLSHILGYVRPPLKDSSGHFYETDFKGLAGIEKSYDARLQGENGLKIIETDVLGAVQSESILEPPRDGGNIHLSVDARLQEALHRFIRTRAQESSFVGGAGIIMDVGNGEILSLVSYPEFNSSVLSEGDDGTLIASYESDGRKPYLNRAISGLYTPGSIVKPIVAGAALAEGIISPSKEIYSPGFITVPNPFNPSKPTIIKDWRVNGWTDMRRALAVSSDVYFFAIGGGYEDQVGLGIERIDKYAKLFGLGAPTRIALDGEEEGLIPTPAWKEEVFGKDDPWRIGDTYNTVIGQYGFQVTPMQIVRAVAAIANGGVLKTPTLLRGEQSADEQIAMLPEHLTVVREGMRQAVEEGTAQALSLPYVEVAAKTGTAEVGVRKQFINSLVIGFFPASAPRYAFAVVMERAPAGTTSGAPLVMRQFLEWLSLEAPEYLSSKEEL